MVNNFEAVIPLLEFPNENTFYFLQILQRKKDLKEGLKKGLIGSNNSARLIKAYYITSVDKLLVQQEEIIALCTLFGARACINLNPRNVEKAAFAVLRKIADQMSNKEFAHVHRAFNSVCGEYHAEMDKRWLIDIDTKEIEFVERVESIINTAHSIAGKGRKVLARLETRAGYHVITNPFNQLILQEHLKTKLDIHRNNPTILYIP
jgi:hypothetical protein